MQTFARIDTNKRMEHVYASLCQMLLAQEPLNRGGAHAQKTYDPNMYAYELLHVSLTLGVDTEFSAWQETVKPNLPWAEDHFIERIGGKPLNPPPSEAYWPYAQAGNSAHKKDQVFSHTYPERIWPKQAGHLEGTASLAGGRAGIRFPYGDLYDLLDILYKDPMSRQAYLPIWFPEDLSAASQGERVPCTLGYHFLKRADGRLDCSYFLRSCDIVRFLRDDIYMAGRLLHYVAFQTGNVPGDLVLHIANLHAFGGDQVFLSQYSRSPHIDARAGYNLDALG